MGIHPTEEDLIKFIDRCHDFETMNLLISKTKPTTDILNAAIKNNLNYHNLIILIENGAIVTHETLKLMKDAGVSWDKSSNGYDYDELEEFIEAAIIGNFNQGIHLYDDQLKLWGEKYYTSEETMMLLQPTNKDEKFLTPQNSELLPCSSIDVKFESAKVDALEVEIVHNQNANPCGKCILF